MRLALAPLALSCRRAAKPLLAAATLALLAGCAQNGTFDLFNPLAGLLGGKSAQAQDGGKAESAATATTAQASTQRAKPPTSTPATPPKPAAPPVKDMGLFGNFEIGAGFGVQKANGFAGKVVGVTDGEPSPDSLRALGSKRQTMEGEEYDLTALGICNDNSNAYLGAKPAHRLRVTSPLTVRFDVKYGQNISSSFLFALYGQDVRLCQRGNDTGKDYFFLELLPGDYEIYAGTRYAVDRPPYTVTLTEQKQPLLTHPNMTLSPGFKEIHARGLLLDYAYMYGPLAQWHELTVTAPMLVELDAALDMDKNYNYRGRIILNVKIDEKTTYQIQPYELNSQVHSVLPLLPGKYRIFITPYWNHDHNDWPPLPYNLSVRENNNLKMQQSLTLNQGFTQTVFKGVWAPGAVMGKDSPLTECSPRKYTSVLNVTAPHKLVVATPKMVHLSVHKTRSHLVPVLRRTSGDTKVFCANETRIAAFLSQGEYELYILRHVDGIDRGRPDQYEVHISTQN